MNIEILNELVCCGHISLRLSQ